MEKLGEDVSTIIYMPDKRNLYIHLTDKCNLFCLHCYCGERLIKKRQMTWDFFQNAVRLFGDEFDIVTLTGGEAVLSPIIYQVIELLNQKTNHLRLDTNGQELDEFFKKVTPQMVSELRFSIDGSRPEINDLIRRRPGSFEKCVANIKKAVALGFFVEMTATITKQNYRDVADIVELAKKLKVAVMNFHLVTVNGNSRDNDVELHPKDWLEVIEKQIKPQKGIKIKYPPRFALGKLPEDYGGCLGSKNERLSVFSGGQAFNCALYFDTDLNSRQVDKDRINFTQSPNETDDFHENNQKHCGACQRFYAITGFSKEDLDKEKIIPLCIYYKKCLN